MYTLNFCSIKCQLYLNKAANKQTKKIQEEQYWDKILK